MMAQGRPRGPGDTWAVLPASNGGLGWASDAPSMGWVLLPALTSLALGRFHPSVERSQESSFSLSLSDL